jgi:hypothetical protein
MASAFDELEKALARAGSPAAKLLAPGAGSLPGLTLPDDLVALHRWHDGLAGEGSAAAELFPGGYWLSLAQAAAEREARLGVAASSVAGTDLDPALIWRDAWWPAFISFDGDAHVVVLDEPGAPVWFVSGQDPADRSQAFASVGELFAIVTECWRTGIFTASPEGVVVDEERYAALRGESPPPTDDLRLALRRGHPMERALAARQLGAARDAAAAPALVAALADPAPDVRAQAIGALGTLKYKPALPALIAALSDGDVAVRIAAGRILAPFKAVEAVPALIRALSDPAPDVRRQAAGALARVKKDPAARAALETLRDDEDPIVRAVAEKAL